MSAEKVFQQCRLYRFTANGTETTTGWIEERGAKVGATVELLPGRGMVHGELWHVDAVFLPKIPESMLKEHQRLNRGSLPSVERTQ